MNKLTKKDINCLIKHFKQLVRKDVEGITATDAKITITEWLYEIGETELGDKFQDIITEYTLSPTIEKMIEGN